MADAVDGTGIQIGTAGEVIPGVRCGLPDHIDGVPVRATTPILTLPRWYGGFGRPLPMAEVREHGDAGKVAARWPEPFPEHELKGRG